MATEEKLKYFYDSTMTALKKKNDNEISLMKTRLDNELEEYKKVHAKEIKHQEHLDEDEIKRELLKDLAGEKLKVRREQSRKEAVIKDKLFEEVKALLDQFRQTPAYEEYLADCINCIVKFAGEDEVIVSLCASDAELKDNLEQKCGIKLSVSEVPFNGGVQAEIPSRNIFINGSLSSEVEEAKKAYIIKA